MTTDKTFFVRFDEFERLLGQGSPEPRPGALARLSAAARAAGGAITGGRMATEWVERFERHHSLSPRPRHP